WKGKHSAFPDVDDLRVTVTAASRSQTGLRDPAIASEVRDAEGRYGTEKDEVVLPDGTCAYVATLAGGTLDLTESAGNGSSEPTVAFASATRQEGRITSLELNAVPMKNGEMDVGGEEMLTVSLFFSEPTGFGMQADSGSIPSGATGTYPIWINVQVPNDKSPNGEQLDINSTDLEEAGLVTRERGAGTIRVTESTDEQIAGVIEADMTWIDFSGLEDEAAHRGEGWDQREARIEEDILSEGETDQVRNLLYATGALRIEFRAVVSPHEGLGSFMCLAPLAERGELSEALTSQVEQVFRMIQGQ
ncbi:MAG: hypothetical protein AAFQ53_14615, partial [Bacteroidota bacterium]